MVISEAQPLDKIFLKMFCNYEFCFNFFLNNPLTPPLVKYGTPLTTNFRELQVYHLTLSPFRNSKLIIHDKDMNID